MVVHIAVHMGGGAGKAISGLVCSVPKNRQRHVILLLEEPKDWSYVNVCRENGIEVCLYERTETYKMEKLLNQADIIVINWWGNPVMAGFMRKVLWNISARWIFWFHVNGCSYPYIPFLMADAADMALFTSPYSFENRLWTEEERKQIEGSAEILYGMGQFQPGDIQAKTDYESDIFHIGYVGTVSYAKMSRSFLDVIEAVYGKIKGLRVTLAGECTEEIKQEIAERNMDHIITCVGKVKDVYRYYRQFDILLYLLEENNYGTTENVLLESMAVGLPVVVFNHPVEKNVVRDRESGFVAADPAEAVGIVTDLALDTEARRQIGTSAREYVCQNYSMDKNGQFYLEAIKKVLKSEKKPYPFEEIMGNSPWEWFVNFTGENKTKFQQLCQGIEDKSDNWTEWFQELDPIYTGDQKGSVYHYLQYFPYDENLKYVAEALKNRRSGG